MNADFAGQIGAGLVHVAESYGEVLGYAVFYSEGDHMHLENLAVSPKFFGIGIGRRLVDFVEQVAIDEGLHAIELYTNEAMTENLAMYPKLGYREVERKAQDGFNRVFFRKSL